MFLIENYTVRPAAEAEADVDLKERSVENSLAVEVVTKINRDSGRLRGARHQHRGAATPIVQGKKEAMSTAGI